MTMLFPLREHCYHISKRWPKNAIIFRKGIVLPLNSFSGGKFAFKNLEMEQTPVLPFAVGLHPEPEKETVRYSRLLFVS